jgi:ribosomal protein S18 acetylase RimI-like enzyme
MDGNVSNRVDIRTLAIEDYDSMVELWKRADLPFKPRGRESKQMIEKQMAAYPGLFLGAFHEERLVGVVVGSYDGRLKGWINRLAVDPAFRRLGIAEQLINHVEEVLEKHGAAIFAALIETPNKQSVELFRKMGYAIHREILYVTKRRSEDV